MSDRIDSEAGVKFPSVPLPMAAPVTESGAAPAPLPAQTLPPMSFGSTLAGSWLLFEVDAQACALDSRQLRQIALAATVRPLPGKGHRAWPGVMAWQQRVLPVLDCGAALGRRPSLGRDGARVLVVQDDARLWALLVDHVRGVHQAQPERLIEVQAGLPAPWSAVRALLPLPADSGGEICPVLHVPTLCRGCLEASAGAPAPGAESPEFRA
jgi:chemotaxis signal transduction protein